MKYKVTFTVDPAELEGKVGEIEEEINENLSFSVDNLRVEEVE